MNLDKFENKKNHLQSIVNQKKEIEQNLIQAKQNIAEDYLQQVNQHIESIEFKDIEERVEQIIKECYVIDNRTGYPLYDIGDLYECSVFDFDFTFPKTKHFWNLALELFDLLGDSLKIKDKFGYWLSGNLFQTIHISSARLIKLSHLKSLFEYLDELDCSPYINLVSEKDYHNMVKIGKMQMRFIYRKK